MELTLLVKCLNLEVYMENTAVPQSVATLTGIRMISQWVQVYPIFRAISPKIVQLQVSFDKHGIGYGQLPLVRCFGQTLRSCHPRPH